MTPSQLPPPLSQLLHPQYRPDIDGLRALAVLSVVAFHAFPNPVKYGYGFGGGFIGVDVFFVISGFLISTIIFENLDKGTFSFTAFYSRRIIRIFPALLLVLIASYAFGWFVLLADEYKQLGKHMAAGAGFVSNFALWDEAGYFDNLSETKPLLHLWSLGIEEQFYIVWPPLLWVAWKNKFNLLTITILVLVISFYLNVKGIKKDAVATFYSPQTRFWELLCGSVLAWVMLYKKDSCSTFRTKLDDYLASIVFRGKSTVDGNALSNVISFLGMSILVYGFWKITKEVRFPGTWALIPVLGTVLIIAAGPAAWINRTILSHKIAVWFGLISFPLYLWHWPLLSFARIVEDEMPSRNIRIAAVLVSILLAWLTYKLVERPLRFREQSRAKVTTLLVLMVVVGYVGYIGHMTRNHIPPNIVNIVHMSLGGERDINGNICEYKSVNGFNDISACEFGDKNSSTSIFLYGDSHAAALEHELHAELISRNIKGIKIALIGGGCEVPPQIIEKGVGAVRGMDCARRFNTLLSYIKLMKSDVIISARWSFKLYPVDGKIADMPYRNSEGGVESEGYREYAAVTNGGLHFDEAAKKEALNVFIKGLISVTPTIFLVYPVPEIGWDIVKLNYRYYGRTKSTLGEISIPYSDYLTRNNFVNTIFDAFEGRTDFVSIKPDKIFCDTFIKDRCVAQYESIPFYFDDDHLSDIGARKIIEAIFRERN